MYDFLDKYFFLGIEWFVEINLTCANAWLIAGRLDVD